MLAEDTPYDLPLNPNALAMYDAQPQDAATQTLGYVLCQYFACLTRPELMQIKHTVNGILMGLLFIVHSRLRRDQLPRP